jgi:tRNA(Leu) C34 or U34 (ribose-2'-O)-methylase TrmL
MTKVPRGFFGIGIYSSKTELNVSNLFRSALAFQADFLYVIGARYKHKKADTTKAPKHIPLYEYRDIDHFMDNLPKGTDLVSVDCGEHLKPHNLSNFVHPERACYILGAEDFGVPSELLHLSKYVVSIPTRVCLNVATAGAVIMYDRAAKS